ncbi:MAG TPA: hypothetical protein ENI14_02345 [Thermoplasmatales archaeon]|nr:hypothetical protein [Thermoplasmatales archaeon]
MGNYMSILIYSDSHYYNNPSMSIINSSGVSSWLHEQLSITRHIFNEAVSRNIKTILFCGDLFEEKDKINVKLYNEVWKLYHSFFTSNSDISIYINSGNHDICSSDRSSSLFPFNAISNINIISSVTDIVADGIGLRIVPYSMLDRHSITDEFPYSQGQVDEIILVTHELISDIPLSSGISSSGNSVNIRSLSDYSLVFNGHIHKPSNVGNIVIVGSMMVNDWRENDEEKRYIIYHGDGKYESIPVDCPKFFTIDNLTSDVIDAIMADNRNFFRVFVSSKEIDNEIFSKYNVFPVVSKNEERKSRISEKSDDIDEIEWYVKLKQVEDLDDSTLISIGKKYANR